MVIFRSYVSHYQRVKIINNETPSQLPSRRLAHLWIHRNPWAKANHCKCTWHRCLKMGDAIYVSLFHGKHTWKSCEIMISQGDFVLQTHNIYQHIIITGHYLRAMPCHLGPFLFRSSFGTFHHCDPLRDWEDQGFRWLWNLQKHGQDCTHLYEKWTCKLRCHRKPMRLVKGNCLVALHTDTEWHWYWQLVKAVESVEHPQQLSNLQTHSSRVKYLISLMAQRVRLPGWSSLPQYDFHRFSIWHAPIYWTQSPATFLLFSQPPLISKVCKSFMPDMLSLSSI